MNLISNSVLKATEKSVAVTVANSQGASFEELIVDSESVGIIVLHIDTMCPFDSEENDLCKCIKFVLATSWTPSESTNMDISRIRTRMELKYRSLNI